MKIKLKKKHLLFLVSDIKNNAAVTTFKLLNEIKQVVTGKPDEAICEIDVNGEDLIRIYEKTSMLPEGQVADINNEMGTLLFPQLQAANEPETLEVAQRINKIREINLSETTRRIEDGRNFLQ